MLRVSIHYPLVRPSAIETGFGCDNQSFRVRVQSFGNQALADLRAVGVGGIDEVDAQFDGSPQNANYFIVVLRLAPDAGAGDPHGAEAEAMDGKIAANAE